MTQLQLQRIQAAAHPGGNRVDLQWYNPAPHEFTGVRVMRRESTHPTTPFDGQLVEEVKSIPLFTVNNGIAGIIKELERRVLSPDLRGYFANAQVPLSAGAGVSAVDPGNRWEVADGDRLFVIASVNGKLEIYDGMSAAADKNIRAEVVYYYMLFPYAGDPPGYVIDPGNRAVGMATGPYDIGGQMYRDLPRIYHRYDVVLPVEHPPGMTEAEKQWGQLRRFLEIPGQILDQVYSLAAAMLELHNRDRVPGQLLPLLAQWIGWETDYNLEIAAQRNELRGAPFLYETIGTIPAAAAAIGKCISGWKSRTKEFVHNVFLSNRPERHNLWLCKQSSAGDGKWEEPQEVFSLDFAYDGRPAAAADSQETIHLFYHTERNGRWEIWTKTYHKDEGWTPSQPFVTGPGNTINKNPSAVFQGETLWVFWESYREDKQTWGINSRKQTAGTWGETNMPAGSLPAGSNPRKSPQAVVDAQNRLWLFWLEKEGPHWQLKYNRHNGTTWEINPADDFPLEGGGNNPRVEKDLFVLYQAQGPNAGIWVFWARKTISAGARGSWEIAFRRKTTSDTIPGGWGPVKTLSKTPPADYDDREPAAVIDENNGIQLAWATNRTGTWTLWNAKWNAALENFDTAVEILPKSPYSRRSPLPLRIDGKISFVYRSNQCISYKSRDYGAVETTDFRYAGSLTVDTRNNALIDLQGEFDDFRAYTHDTGENGKLTNNNRYSRGTIGLYLTPDTQDQKYIARSQEYIKDILERFLPIQTRAVFIIEPPTYRETVYTYDFPDEKPPRFIAGRYFDTYKGTVLEEYTGINEVSEDRVPGWIWLRAWGPAYPDHRTVNFNAVPIDKKYRTWHIGIKTGG